MSKICPKDGCLFRKFTLYSSDKATKFWSIKYTGVQNKKGCVMCWVGVDEINGEEKRWQTRESE